MNNLNNNKKVIFICIILVVISLLIVYFVEKSKIDKNDVYTNRDAQIERYEANQYIPVYVTEESMVNKYLNDFRNLVLNDVNAAYDVLNDDYKKMKFKDINGFINYVNELDGTSFYSLTADKYIVKTVNGYKYFDIYGSDGNRYIFKELSIMNYEVYLDAYTINID